VKRALALFSVVAVLHFVLSVAGILAVLPAAFETQAGFRAAPGKAILAWTSSREIAVVSVLFGAAAVGLARGWRALKAQHGNGLS
jgi:hypothetical protein